MDKLYAITSNSNDVEVIFMKNNIFYTIIIIVCLIGFILTGSLVKYTIDLSKQSSITAFISNEE